MRAAWLLALAVGCGSAESTPIDRAARATFALGGRCCDGARFEPLPPPSVADPDAVAMIAAGSKLYKPREPVEVDLCGARSRAGDLMLVEFRGALVEVIWSGADCASILRACTERLGEPSTRKRDMDAELALYKSSSTYIRIVRAGTLCSIALQDALATAALEAAMAKR